MNVFTLFRITVVAPIILAVASAVYIHFMESSLSQEWQDLLSWRNDGGLLSYAADGNSALTWTIIICLALLLLAALVNQVLFFFYWKPSRRIFLIFVIISYASLLILGLEVLTPVEHFLLQLSTLLIGVSLALAFHSPVSQRFSGKP